MKLSKLQKVHVIIIGSVVCVLIGVGAFFLLIKPALGSMAELQQRYDAAAPEAGQIDMAQMALDEAIRKVNEVESLLDSYMTAKMPNIDFTNRAEGMVQLWHEQSERLGPLLERYAGRTGVKVLNERIPVPAPPVNPNDPSIGGVIALPLGNVRVQGNFSQVLDHIRKWNNCERLVMINTPTLTGPSPTLQAEYHLTVFILPRGDVGPPIELAGGGGDPGVMGMMGMPQ